MEGEELSSVPGGDMDGDASVGSAAGKQPAGAEAGDPLAGGPGRSHGGDEAQLPGAAARRAECDQEEKTKTEGEDNFAPNMVVMGAGAPAPSLGHGAYSTCAVDSEDGTCGASFLTFLTDLENDGILVLHRGEALPPRLKGLCGWTIHEDKMDEWKRRRQLWFMQGKEGKVYKANSLYQFLRRLGFFPTEGTKRASHGLDFDGSRTFKWDGSRRHKYIQSKKEKNAISIHASSRGVVRAGPGHMAMYPSGDVMGLGGGMVMGSQWHGLPFEAPPGRPLPVHHGLASGGMGAGINGAGLHYSPLGSLHGLGHSQMVQYAMMAGHEPQSAAMASLVPPHHLSIGRPNGNYLIQPPAPPQSCPDP